MTRNQWLSLGILELSVPSVMSQSADLWNKKYKENLGWSEFSIKLDV